MYGLIFVIGVFAPLESNPAYLDPGSGSLILQIILATLLGAVVIIRSFWTKIKTGILRLFNRNPEDTDQELNE